MIFYFQLFSLSASGVAAEFLYSPKEKDSHNHKMEKALLYTVSDPGSCRRQRRRHGAALRPLMLSSATMHCMQSEPAEETRPLRKFPGPACC